MITLLGGNTEGTRLAYIYDDSVPKEEITPKLVPLFAFYKSSRNNGESFGDFCHRQGKESLAAFAATWK